MCRECSRLVTHRELVASRKISRFSSWEYWGRPVSGFGDPLARILILGLAPAAHGANRTGRVFTGDQSSKFLMKALHAVGMCNQPTSEHSNDGLRLRDVYITSAVKCVPPGDRPTVREQTACRKFLTDELSALPNVQIVLTLGKIAFDSFIRTSQISLASSVSATFQHGKHYPLGKGKPLLIASYHPSPRNTNTGRIDLAAFTALLTQTQLLLQ